VITDPSHSTGSWELVPPISLASIAAGAHGIIVDVHPNPSEAKCDAAQALTFNRFKAMVKEINIVTAALNKI